MRVRLALRLSRSGDDRPLDLRKNTSSRGVSDPRGTRAGPTGAHPGGSLTRRLLSCPTSAGGRTRRPSSPLHARAAVSNSNSRKR